MGKSLVIVESPAKAKTINKYLGEDFTVMASIGHIKDLPMKDLGVDVENNFEPTYVVIPDTKKRNNKKVVSDLKKAALFGLHPIFDSARGTRHSLEQGALALTQDEQGEVRDSFRDWRIVAPIVVLTFLFPFLAQFVAGRFSSFVADYGAEIVAPEESEPPKVVDLMEALRRSLNAVSTEKKKPAKVALEKPAAKTKAANGARKRKAG